MMIASASAKIAGILFLSVLSETSSSEFRIRLFTIRILLLKSASVTLSTFCRYVVIAYNSTILFNGNCLIRPVLSEYACKQSSNIFRLNRFSTRILPLSCLLAMKDFKKSVGESYPGILHQQSKKLSIVSMFLIASGHLAEKYCCKRSNASLLLPSGDSFWR